MEQKPKLHTRLCLNTLQKKISIFMCTSSSKHSSTMSPQLTSHLTLTGGGHSELCVSLLFLWTTTKLFFKNELNCSYANMQKLQICPRFVMVSMYIFKYVTFCTSTWLYFSGEYCTFYCTTLHMTAKIISYFANGDLT